MNKFIIIFSAFIGLNGCTTQNKNENKIETENSLSKKSEIKTVSLSESTRGTIRIYTLSSNQLEISINGNVSHEILQKNDWNTILSEIDKINVENISNYEAPSTKRFSDAALSSVISIKIKEQNLESLSFDSGNPPIELKGLYNEIMKIVNIKKSK